MPPYVSLWCKSNFSFLEGASHPEELIEQCEALGLPVMALCDRDGVPGMVRAHVASKERGVRLIAGSEVTVSDGSTLVLLCADRGGSPTSAGSSPRVDSARRRVAAWSSRRRSGRTPRA